MIFDHLTPPQDHQFAFCSANHPRQFDMPHDHVQNIFDTPGHPQHPQVPPLGHDQATELKSRSICFISFICENTHKFGTKIFEIDFFIEN